MGVPPITFNNRSLIDVRLVVLTANLFTACLPPMYTKFLISKVQAILQGMPLVELASKQMSLSPLC